MKCGTSALFAITLLLSFSTLVAADAAKSGGSSSFKPASMTLPPEVDMTAAQTFIRLGFGLDKSVNFQALEMLTPRMRTVQAQQLIRMVGRYNNFSGHKVADALGEFRGVVSGVRFGREGSPVIYIDLPYWTHQREESQIEKGQRILDSATEKLIHRLEEVFVKNLGADEFSADANEVRVWWD